MEAGGAPQRLAWGEAQTGSLRSASEGAGYFPIDSDGSVVHQPEAKRAWEQLAEVLLQPAGGEEV